MQMVLKTFSIFGKFQRETWDGLGEDSGDI